MVSDFAQLDTDRRSRTGIAEAIYAPGKTPEQCAQIVLSFLETDSVDPVLLSRPDEDQIKAALAVCEEVGEEASPTHTAQVRERLVFWRPLAPRTDIGKILIATAGTGDLPPAKECQAVLEAYGVSAELICDVGVAGIHRTLEASEQLAQAQAVVVVAGMEGALASVVGGLTSAPVVAVPSSVGYGSSLEGVTALLAMLSSCSPGVTVVGIDNGFGAACAVLRLLNATPTTSCDPPAPTPAASTTASCDPAASTPATPTPATTPPTQKGNSHDQQ